MIKISRIYDPDGDSTNASSFGVSTLSFTSGSFYLMIIQMTGATATGSITATPGAVLWTPVAEIGNSTNRLQIFRSVATASLSNQTVSIGSFGGGGSISGFKWTFLEVSGVKISGNNGSDAIIQVGTGSSGIISLINPGIEMQQITGKRNSIFAVFTNNFNPFSGSISGSRWEELRRTGYETPSAGYYEVYKNLIDPNNIDNNFVRVSASLSQFRGIALELNMVKPYRDLPLYYY